MAERVPAETQQSLAICPDEEVSLERQPFLPPQLEHPVGADGDLEVLLGINVAAGVACEAGTVSAFVLAKAWRLCRIGLRNDVCWRSWIEGIEQGALHAKAQVISLAMIHDEECRLFLGYQR